MESLVLLKYKFVSFLFYFNHANYTLNLHVIVKILFNSTEFNTFTTNEEFANQIRKMMLNIRFFC